MADLKQSGTTPVEREVLIMSVMNGRSLFKHWVKKEARQGIKLAGLDGVFFDDALDKGDGDWLKAGNRRTREGRRRWKWARGIVIQRAAEILYLLFEVMIEEFLEIIRQIGGR